MLEVEPFAYFIQLPEQIFVLDVRINLGRFDVGMSESGLHGESAPADVEQFGGERMPDIVEMEIFYPGAFQCRPPGGLEIFESLSGLFKISARQSREVLKER
jgi:hypothetical protein